MFCSPAIEELFSARKCFDEICKSDDELAESYWKMINDFEHPTVFVSEEICLLWVSTYIALSFPHVRKDTGMIQCSYSRQEHKVSSICDWTV